MCQKDLAKYKCPRCDLETCCLTCVKEHKDKFCCSGERDKCKFVKVDQYTESTMISDFGYLKEVFNRTEQLPKMKKGHPRCFQTNTRWMLLQNRARGLDITLKYLPVNSSRRKANTSIYNRIKDIIFWRVEWRFCDTILFTNEIEDYKLLGSVLYSVITDHKSELENFLQQEPIIENLKILMKVENQPSNLTSYFDLDPQSSIRDNLITKMIMEFPCFYVVLPTMLEKYPLYKGPISLDTFEVKQEEGEVRTEDQTDDPEIEDDSEIEDLSL